jgi:ABC-type dipeptide/oligopeptide/nickel transport system permease subunit
VGAWWGLIFPGMAILITIISLNLLGDGISKIINPKTAKRG